MYMQNLTHSVVKKMTPKSSVNPTICPLPVFINFEIQESVEPKISIM